MDAQLYVKQLRAGRDFGQHDAMAGGMANFVYLVGDRAAGECLVVDPAWDVAGILAAASADDMRITGALATHYHPDHVGGPMFGHSVEGLAQLMELSPCKVHVHKIEAAGVKMLTGLSDSDLVKHDGGDRVAVGGLDVQLLHTPGHTPGSICFRCGDVLIAGDTLFLQGCGRVDLPGGDSDEMWRTLSQRLSTIADHVMLYPGHDYGDRPHASMGDVRRDNMTLRIPDLPTWRRFMG
ncbi:MAG: MBL fold metallo-hydrolase [Deltaproteobacteria bacterium]|nr:MBL fold metallo-hydrolase [Deltaproteobacteria bacterium]MBW2255493.1 MBL fold metallo-hydrolase [Deltaproteobacteria bacterium]